MRSGILTKLGILAAAGVCSLLLAGAATAQNPDRLKELEDKINKQDEQIKLLLQKLGDSPNVSVGAEGGLEKKDVEKIINDTLKKEAEAKKKKDDEKKKEDDAKKKADAEKFVEVGSDMSIKAVWKNGLQFETPNKDFTFTIRGRVDWDNGWFAPEFVPLPIFDDASDFRRARIGVEGRMWEVVSWIAEWDFADPAASAPTTTFTDVFMNIEQIPLIGNLRGGHFKEFFSLEQLTSARFTTFLERSLLDQAFVPSRNNGLAIWRTFGDDERVWAGTGIWRPGTNNGGFDSGDGEYAWTSRICALPYWASEGRCLIHVGAAYSHRAYTNSFPTFAAQPEVRLGTPLLLSTGTINNAADQDLAGAEFAAVFGPFSVQAEAVWTDLSRRNAANTANLPGLEYWGYYAQASYFLTGEHRPYKRSTGAFDRVIPNEPYYFVKGHNHKPLWGSGAWELAVRYSYLDLTDNNLIVPATTGTKVGGTGTMHDFTFGVNWYLNPNMKLMWNYIHSRRDSDTAARDGSVDLLAMRFHWDW